MNGPPPSETSSIDSGEVLDLLTSLVEKSLVLYEEHEGEGRYRLLETVRQYGRDRLLESEEGEAIHDRHLAFFLALAEEAEPALWSDTVWIERLGQEHGNLRAALDWSVGQSPQEGLRLAGALWRFWEVRGFYQEAIERLGSALAESAPADPTVRAKALWTRGFALIHACGHTETAPGVVERAIALSEESLSIYRELADRSGMGWSLMVQQWAAWNRGDVTRFRTLAEEALTLFRAIEDKPGIARGLQTLGCALELEGDIEQAAAMEEESLALCRREGYRWVTAITLNQLGRMALKLGQVERARALQEEALVLFHQFGNRQGIAHTLAKLAELAEVIGNYAQAKTLYEESLTISQGIGHGRFAAGALIGLASIAQAQADFHRAVALFEEAKALARRLGDNEWVSEIATDQGRMLLELGECAEARSCYEEALELRRVAENTAGLAWTLVEAGHAAWMQGEHGVTQAHAAEALGLFRSLDNTRGLLIALESLAAASLGQGRNERAARLLGAVEAQRKATKVLTPDWWRDPQERIRNAVLSVVLEQNFATAWSEGQALTLEQAVAYALEESADA